MVIDSSALIAILEKEPEALALALAIEGDPRRVLSAATYLEASILIESRRGEAGVRELDMLIHKAGIEIAPVTREQAEIGRQAFSKFGKGRHPARLNYGDCFSYALAIDIHEPLLFKGKDFSKTDVIPITMKRTREDRHFDA